MPAPCNPTLVEDSNGNQIIIHYMAGAGANWNDSSARITSVEDARAVPYTDPGAGDTLYHSYSFTYTTLPNGLPYLTSISSYVGTPESYTFTYNCGWGIWSPTGVSFGTTSYLASVNFPSPFNYSYTFNYDFTLSEGDLTEVEFPQGGHLKWTYTNCAYAGSQTIREVENRYLMSTPSRETRLTHSRRGTARPPPWTTPAARSDIGSSAAGCSARSSIAPLRERRTPCATSTTPGCKSPPA